MATYATCRMTVQDSGGNVLPNATVQVNRPGTSTPVAGTLFSDNGLTQTLGNPLTTDAYGGLLFYMAQPQNVDLAVSLAGYSTRTIADVSVQLEVAADGGWVIGNPTGGDQGAGTLNAQGVYVQGAGVAVYQNAGDNGRKVQSANVAVTSGSAGQTILAGSANFSWSTTFGSSPYIAGTVTVTGDACGAVVNGSTTGGTGVVLSNQSNTSHTVTCIGIG